MHDSVYSHKLEWWSIRIAKSKRQFVLLFVFVWPSCYYSFPNTFLMCILIICWLLLSSNFSGIVQSCISVLKNRAQRERDEARYTCMALSFVLIIIVMEIIRCVDMKYIYMYFSMLSATLTEDHQLQVLAYTVYYVLKTIQPLIVNKPRQDITLEV